LCLLECDSEPSGELADEGERRVYDAINASTDVGIADTGPDGTSQKRCNRVLKNLLNPVVKESYQNRINKRRNELSGRDEL